MITDTHPTPPPAIHEDGDGRITPSPHKPGKFELHVFTVGYRRGGEWSYVDTFETIEEAKEFSTGDYCATLTIEV